MSNSAALDAERPDSPGVTINGQPIKTAGMGGAFEGADRIGKELASWTPRVVSADGAMSQRDKLLVDARSKDMTRNSGMMQGASNLYKDTIVGSQYRLNCSPNLIVLGLDDVWAEEYQREVEAKFGLWAESADCWVDASRMNTFTGLIRLAIGCTFAGGEVLATAEWLKSRPYSTCLQMINADRLSNPQDGMDTKYLRRGIERDRNGAPIAAHIRMGHPRDTYAGTDAFTWKRVPFRKPWGRLQVLHVFEQGMPEQSRGVSGMVSVLKESRMAKSFHEITLQNAIVNASYAAAIESELPPQMAFESIGATTGVGSNYATEAMSMLQAIADYSRGGRNLEIDGVKIPHLFPGSKLKLFPAGTVGGVGQTFEESLHRYIAAGLGISYEEYTRDYSKVNYASGRLATNNTRRFMMARKRSIADRVANAIFSLWLEEAISKGEITSMPRNAPNFYEGMNKDAYCRATWIGAGLGQVDEMKETQAALMRIHGGLSTYEIECARLGYDFRDVYEQSAREQKRRGELGLDFNTSPSKPGTVSSMREDGGDNTDTKNNKDAAAPVFDDGFGDD